MSVLIILPLPNLTILPISVDKKPKLVRRASFYVDKELSIHAYYTDHRNQAVLKMIACGKMTSD